MADLETLKAEAKKLVTQAETEYKLGRFQQALDLYSRAYETYKAPGLFFNIGSETESTMARCWMGRPRVYLIPIHLGRSSRRCSCQPVLFADSLRLRHAVSSQGDRFPAGRSR